MSVDDCDLCCQNFVEFDPISGSDSSFHVDDSNNSSDSVELFNHKVRFEHLFSVYNIKL